MIDHWGGGHPDDRDWVGDPDDPPAPALPDELEVMPPGPRLSAVLAEVDRATLSTEDLLRLARARNRQIAHEQAQQLADLHRIARSVPDQGRQAGRRDPAGKYPWADCEVAFALTWTAVKANGELQVADEAIDRLPALHAALAAGEIDRPKLMVFLHALAGVDDRVARGIVDRLIDAASRLTTGQLAARLRRLVLAAAPDAAEHRAKTEIRDRRVAAFLNDNNLAALCGYELAPHRVAAAVERLTAIARAAKAAGDPRRLEQLRADAFLDLLVGEGVAAGGGVSDGDLPGDRPPPAEAADGDRATPWPAAPADPLLLAPDPPPSTPHPATPPQPQPPVADPTPEPARTGDSDEEELRDLWYAGFDHLATHRSHPTPTAAPRPLPAPRRGVVDIQVPLTTLLRLTELPGELEGFGPVIADVARQVAARQRDARWRFSVCDDDGQLAYHGITTARPTRRPTAADAAFVKARDRTCRAPGCRRPARHCDIDHTVDWVYSNDSRRCNLACLCRKHHLFKHSAGVELVRHHDILTWRTPAGLHYRIRPDPYPHHLEPPELAQPPPEVDPADLQPQRR